MSSRHLDQYKGNFYIIDEVLIANLSPAKAPVKATSHSTIFNIPMRPLREDQKHRYRFAR